MPTWVHSCTLLSATKVLRQQDSTWQQMCGVSVSWPKHGQFSRDRADVRGGPLCLAMLAFLAVSFLPLCHGRISCFFFFFFFFFVEELWLNWSSLWTIFLLMTWLNSALEHQRAVGSNFLSCCYENYACAVSIQNPIPADSTLTGKSSSFSSSPEWSTLVGVRFDNFFVVHYIFFDECRCKGAIVALNNGSWNVGFRIDGMRRTKMADADQKKNNVAGTSVTRHTSIREN